jgi:gamma-glutamyl:cysteine ligase YbdK (ATP-grasp superfamily)
LEDALSIAALFRCLLRMLWRLKRENQRWRLYAHMLIDENRWRAQRYGTTRASSILAAAGTRNRLSPLKPIAVVSISRRRIDISERDFLE